MITAATDPTSLSHLATIGHKLDRATIAAGLSLLECLAADHPAGVTLAESLGVDDEHFADDLGIIWGVLSLGKAWPTERLFRLMRVALQRHHFWCDAEILANYGDAGRWSEPMLRHLFDAEFPSEVLTRHYAAKLIKLCNLNRRLETALSDADRVCWPQKSKSPTTVRASRPIVNVGAA